MPFIKLATLEEVASGTARQVTANGRKVGLFNVNGAIYAIDDTCPHRGAPLSEGFCEGTEVECPWHGARFDLASGAHLCLPAESGVTAYKVQVVGNEIQVELP